MTRVRYPEITVLVFPVLEGRKTVLRKGCASLRPKAKNCQPFQNTLSVRVTNTGKNFEHGTNLDNRNNRIFLIEGLSKLLLPTFMTLVERFNGRNCFNLFQISFSANTADAHPGV